MTVRGLVPGGRIYARLHLYDSPARLADVRYAIDLHGGHTILRLGSDDNTRDPDDAEAEEALDR